MKTHLILAAILLFSCCTPNQAGLRADEHDSIYLIGNSLTWDTLPSLLGDDVEWHIDCGKNLKYIFDNPKQPCVKSSRPWTDALRDTQYDVLCVQPHFGTTLREDVTVISQWMEMQPKARLIIHTGWNRHKDFKAVFHAKIDHERMVHAPAYFDRLVAQLQEKFPNRSIKTTGMIQILDSVQHDIEQSEAPFDSLEQLYRDEIHFKNQVGRYLAHNMMRVAMDKPTSDQGFQVLSDHKLYFDRKIAEYAEAQKR